MIGKNLQVFPGDRFYSEGDLTAVPVLELAAPFESKMPGAGGFSFNFAIDSTKLRYAGSSKNEEWDYLAGPKGSVRAWHRLLGTVLAERDHVGVRVNRKTGAREWYVNNTNHNANMGYDLTTIWSRPVNPKKDVEVRQIGTEDVLIPGSRLRSLEYLGLQDGQLRIRYDEIGPTPRTEEFFFPVEGKTPFLIGVKGLRAQVLEVAGTSARISILQGFKDSGFASPSP